MLKPRITLLADTLLLLTLAALAGLGLMLQFVLIPATGPEEQVTIAWLGLTRRHWEAAYFSGALLALALTALHLVLHRAHYATFCRQAVPSPTARNVLAPLGTILALLLLCLPLLAKPRLRQGEPMAGPELTPSPAQASGHNPSPVGAAPAPPAEAQAKAASRSPLRPAKISRAPRPPAPRVSPPLRPAYGQWSRRKYRYCSRVPHRAYVLTARRP
ncbi:MAG: DUF4405 domain-containing protein [Desulfobaccales bacterium]